MNPIGIERKGPNPDPRRRVPAVSSAPVSTAAVSSAAETPRGPGGEGGVTAATIRRAQGGDAQALGDILEAVRPRVVALAFRMVRDADEAEDVVQDALTKVWRNLSRYESRAAFSTWLHRIVVNTALDHLRARRSGVVAAPARAPRRDDESDGDDHDLQKVDPTTPEELLARAQVGRAVRGAMGDLSLAHREILVWREFEGESYQDIARLARCPVGTVMSRLHHARHRLAATLTANVGELMPRAA